VDGNLCARKADNSVEVHWVGKFRGMDFAPMHFALRTVTARRLMDKRGRHMYTVLATPIDEAGRAAMVAAGRRDEDRVLLAIREYPGASTAELAEKLGWAMRDGKPYKVKVQRAIDQLMRDKLVAKHRDSWTLTAQGEKEFQRLKNDEPGPEQLPEQDSTTARGF
jgi:hypothetical protein